MRNGWNKLKKWVNKWRWMWKEIWTNTLYYHAYYHCKIKPNVALVESRAGEDLAGNMFRIAQELVKRGYKVYVTQKKGYEKKIRRLLRAGGLENVKVLRMYSRKHYHAMATAKYLFCDTVFDWKFIKKEGQVYVNTWHGTPLKTLGYQVSGEQYLMGNGQRNFLMADYIAVPNQYYIDRLAEAYYLNNIYHGKVLYSGSPRNQAFYDDASRARLREALRLRDKKVYVYMPTWRGSHAKGDTTFLTDMVNMLSYLDAYMTEDQVIYAKLHNMTRKGIDFVQFEHIKPFPEEYEPYEVLNCADCLITDYSSVFFDFANTGRKVILYVPDKAEYSAGRGMYFSIDELPFTQVYDPQSLLDEMSRAEFTSYPDFQKRFCEFDGPDSTARLLDRVIEGKETCKEGRLPSNGKKNIAVYSANIQWKNGIATAYMSLLNRIDTSKYNYYLTFYRKTSNAACSFFEEIPDEVGIFSISSTLFLTFWEKIAYHLQQNRNIQWSWMRRTLDRLYDREIVKLFFDAPFDGFIHFEGYGTNDTIPVFQHYPKFKAIFVHNDMVREIETRHNQHPAILKEAYRSYDKIAIVSPDLFEPTVQLGAPAENVVVVNNTHETQGIKEQGERPIEFEKDTECRTSNPGGIEGVLSSPGKKFITIGRFSKEKGHQRLLRAFDRFCEDYPDTQLIIVGGHGVLYNSTLKWVGQLKHWKNVTVMKSIKNPMPILKRCDLFVLSSFHEGLPMTIKEADVLGVPVISTDIPGPREFLGRYHGHLVEDSEAGILQGMYDYMNGLVTTLDIDYAQYNKQALAEFESLFEDVFDNE